MNVSPVANVLDGVRHYFDMAVGGQIEPGVFAVYRSQLLAGAIPNRLKLASRQVCDLRTFQLVWQDGSHS